jgi:hypothetical protein
LHLDDIMTAGADRLQDAEAKALLGQPRNRACLYRRMHPRPEPSLAPLLRVLLQHEVEYRGALDSSVSGDCEADDEDAFEYIYWCAFLLAQLGDPEDVIRLWRAKHTNFDVGCGFDTEALLGAGIHETLAYLSRDSSPEAAEARAYLEGGLEREVDERLARWRRFRTDYFSPENQ